MLTYLVKPSVDGTRNASPCSGIGDCSHVLLTMLHYWVSYLLPFDYTSALLIPQDVAFDLLDQSLRSYDTTASPCTRFVVRLLISHCLGALPTRRSTHPCKDSPQELLQDVHLLGENPVAFRAAVHHGYFAFKGRKVTRATHMAPCLAIFPAFPNTLCSGLSHQCANQAGRRNRRVNCGKLRRFQRLR